MGRRSASCYAYAPFVYRLHSFSETRIMRATAEGRSTTRLFYCESGGREHNLASSDADTRLMAQITTTPRPAPLSLSACVFSISPFLSPERRYGPESPSTRETTTYVRTKKNRREKNSINRPHTHTQEGQQQQQQTSKTLKRE